MWLYAAYGGFDYILLNGDVGAVWLIRYCVGLPLLVGLFFAGHSASVRRFHQTYAVIGISIIALTTLWMIAQLQEKHAYVYHASLLTLVMGGLTIARMRFRAVLIAGAIFSAGSCIVLVPAFFRSDLLAYFLVLDVGVAIFCSANAYAYEFSLRKSFLQQVLIAHNNAQLAEANTRLKVLSEVDSLTGIYNRRFLDNAMDEEWRRARRMGYRLSFLMCDIDFFKLYNDTYGHLVGDQCIRKVAQRLQSLFHRPGDVVARYGGEEFAVLLPGLEASEAHALAKVVCAEIQALAIPHSTSTVADVVTISIGVADILPNEESETRDLCRMADEGLYLAKRSGRNRAECFGDAESCNEAGILSPFSKV
ncbi:hypothetical protein HDN1F_12960 [gamma proteobacterium HdN1]|nr:hypothetical protein HDN1F_12960 [gamma proteobacterium HdN1]